MLGDRRLRQADSVHNVAADAAGRGEQQPQDAQPCRMRERLGQFSDLDVGILRWMSGPSSGIKPGTPIPADFPP